MYDELRTYFPTSWGRLDPYFARQLKQNFEAGIESMFSDIDYGLPFQGLMRNMAEYFCEFHPKDDSNLYIQLLNELHDEIYETVFSTLNYDLLFENALKRNGLIPNHLLGTSQGIVFCKLHGSCNFWPRADFRNVPMRGGNIIAIGLYDVDADKSIRLCHSGRSDYPVMCMYMKGKPTQVGGNVIKAIQAKWTEYVSAAEKILIIGVKPYLDDTHVWEPLSKTNAKIGYIGELHSFSSWKKSHRKNKQTRFISDRWCTHIMESVKFLRE